MSSDVSAEIGGTVVLGRMNVRSLGRVQIVFAKVWVTRSCPLHHDRESSQNEKQWMVCFVPFRTALFKNEYLYGQTVTFCCNAVLSTLSQRDIDRPVQACDSEGTTLCTDTDTHAKW